MTKSPNPPDELVQLNVRLNAKKRQLIRHLAAILIKQERAYAKHCDEVDQQEFEEDPSFYDGVRPEPSHGDNEYIATLCGTTVSESWDLENEVYKEACRQLKDQEACPGCGCRPGDGLTAGCNDPLGCGYFRELEQVHDRR
jgi:hypothetical protein